MSRTIKRCALYTRKSTEKGLDQEFNSLGAQREACAAYVKSQAIEGWRTINTLYGGRNKNCSQRHAKLEQTRNVRLRREVTSPGV